MGGRGLRSERVTLVPVMDQQLDLQVFLQRHRHTEDAGTRCLAVLDDHPLVGDHWTKGSRLVALARQGLDRGRLPSTFRGEDQRKRGHGLMRDEVDLREVVATPELHRQLRLEVVERLGEDDHVTRPRSPHF